VYRKQKISVVIPCFNEEQGIAYVLNRMPGWIDEIIVVDNNSTDGTARVAERFGVRVIFESVRGYGSSYKAAFPHAKGDVIVTLDGDGQYPSEAIAPAIDVMLSRHLDFVSTTRFPLSNPNSMCLRNILGNKLQTYAMRLLFWTNISDSQSGMWVFRRNVLDCITLESKGMSFSEEIKIEAILHKDIRFGELHIDYCERIGKTKLFPWRDGIMNMWFLLKRRFGIGRLI